MITPFKDNGNLTRLQRQFNAKLSSERQVVERTIGHVKGRFRRLRDIDSTDIKHICYMITSACVLHNLCISCNDELAEILQQDLQNHNPNIHNGIYADTRAGVARRNLLLQRFEQSLQ